MYVHVHLYISHAVQMSDSHASGLIAQNRLINPTTYYHDPSNPNIYDMHVHTYVHNTLCAFVNCSSVTMVTKIERITPVYVIHMWHDP